MYIYKYIQRKLYNVKMNYLTVCTNSTSIQMSAHTFSTASVDIIGVGNRYTYIRYIVERRNCAL